MQEFGKILVLMGIGLAVVGAVLWFAGPRGWLPGDITVKRENFTIHFPIVTCIVVSIVLTLLFQIFRR
ncbi:MAG: DUF2905 domain-containing protein [Terrimicrobiaceae bacterium]|nr:DUF2905 domain-containing protein [Terrimicrobiaceae bacterium]